MAQDQPDDGHPTLSDNRLLRALSAETQERLRPKIELVPVQVRDPLLEQRKPITFVYFPIDGVGSLLSELQVGRSVEVATVGFEGMIGLPVFLNAASTSAYMAFVQVPGRLWRMSVDDFRAELRNGSELHDVLQRYTQALFGQLSVNVACNRAHTVDERLPRWLLMTHDRARRDEFPMTPEFLAQMLGVRRATVNEACRSLQERGLISYLRGQMAIVDRENLEGASCECYGRLNEEFDRLFPG
jgi:CRP-like cAMP-binding protein